MGGAGLGTGGAGLGTTETARERWVFSGFLSGEGTTT
jgi:hypothetical protein